MSKKYIKNNLKKLRQKKIKNLKTKFSNKKIISQIQFKCYAWKIGVQTKFKKYNKNENMYIYSYIKNLEIDIKIIKKINTKKKVLVKRKKIIAN